MNIHLLRLNRKTMSNYKTEIKNFINKIKNTTEYVIQNGIKPIAKLFGLDDEIDVLKDFCEDYEYNQKRYYKPCRLSAGLPAAMRKNLRSSARVPTFHPAPLETRTG